MKKHTHFTRSLLALGLVVLILSACSLPVGPNSNASPAAGLETGQVTSLTISDFIESSGSVLAAQSGKLTWKTSGIVETVPVKAGQIVEAGAVLATLRLTSVPSNILAAQADLINARQALEDLSPTALAISQAEQRVAAAQDDVDRKQRIVDGLGTPARASDIEQANATVLLAKIQLDRAWDRYKPFQNRPENNPIRAALYNAWAQAQQTYDQSVRRLNNLKGVSINPNDQQLAEANLQLAQATLTDARQRLEELKAGANTVDVEAIQARITAAEATLSALSLTAPFPGELLVVDVQPGDLVSANQLAFTLADRSRLHVDTLIDETDISNIRLGDTAAITLDALPGQSLTGVVSFINPMGETVAGNVKYLVRIDLKALEAPVLLGATADVTIQIGASRQTLAVPVRAIQTDSAGEYISRVGTDGSLVRVDIVSGQLIGDLVVILEGDLQEGDTLVLPVAGNEMFDRMQNMGGEQ
jgi:RND family efflux transporter MFP subunit